MKRRGRIEIRGKWKFATVFILLVGFLSSMFYIVESRMYYQKREQFVYLAANQSSIMEGCMDTVFARAYTLSAMLTENGGRTDFFDVTAAKIYEEASLDSGQVLKNIAVAPKGIVERVYPLKGNESLIGFNFMDEKLSGNKEAVRAYYEGKMVVTDPFNLVQGGKGVAARLPIFVPGPGGNAFWGLVTVTMDYDSLMRATNIENLRKLNVDYCVWYTDATGQRVDLEKSKDMPVDPITYNMSPKNLKWHIDVAPHNGWYNYYELGLGFLAILVLSAGIVYIFWSRAKISEANKLLQALAIKDSLTDCYSRHYVNSILLKQPGDHWRDVHAAFSLAIVDVDKFKDINDTFGHDVGDMALKAVSRVLKDSCEEYRADCVIRHGGDEFVVLYSNVEREIFERKLKEIVAKVAAVRFNDLPELRLSISVGGVLNVKDKSYYELLTMADAKLYVSKENGRNQYTI